ncbi:MAG: hypothetical protein ACJ8FY_26240 [Gemmataceae bacterium]
MIAAFVSEFYLLQIAGILHLLVASVNFFAPRKLHYQDNLRKVTPIFRDIFVVQNIYIVMILFVMAGLCFLFGDELMGRSALGRFLSGFMAFFWALRVMLQLFYYDPAVKRQFPVYNGLFLTCYCYLTALFAFLVAFPRG